MTRPAVDGAAEHEMAADSGHRLEHCLPQHRLAQLGAQPGPDAIFVFGGFQRPPGQRQRPRRHIDEHRRRMPDVPVELGRHQLVADEKIAGGGVWDAQQRLRQHHQHQPFLAREVVFMHQSIDRPRLPLPGADRNDQLGGQAGRAQRQRGWRPSSASNAAEARLPRQSA